MIIILRLAIFLIAIITVHELGHIVSAKHYGILRGIGMYIGNPGVCIDYPHPVVCVCGFLFSFLSYPFYYYALSKAYFRFPYTLDLIFVATCALLALGDFVMLIYYGFFKTYVDDGKEPKKGILAWWFYIPIENILSQSRRMDE